MQLPHVRFTVRRMMIAVAYIGALMGLEANRARRGHRLIDLTYPCVVDNDPLNNSLKVVQIDRSLVGQVDHRQISTLRIAFEAGQMIEIGDEARLTPYDRTLEVETDGDGCVVVYAKCEH